LSLFFETVVDVVPFRLQSETVMSYFTKMDYCFFCSAFTHYSTMSIDHTDYSHNNPYSKTL